MSDPLELALKDILAWVADDHSSVFAAESSVAEFFGWEPRERLRMLTAAAVEALNRAGLVDIGVPQGGTDFLVDSSPPDAIGRRIYDEWDADPYASQIANWMNITPLGEEVHGEGTREPLDQALRWAREAAERRGLTVPTEPAPEQPRDDVELRNVRDLPDGPDHAVAYHERLRGGGVDVTPDGFDPNGVITRLKDASFIIWRPRSADGRPALEFDIPSRGKVKLRYRG
ncbi:MAG TPA: hypothetical protein VGL20_03855 [Candidatus Dormibacteraeota bacterium]